jgi:hypothetical protein
MTEEQAKTKWCPMSNYQSYGNRPFKSASLDEGSIGCLASNCMAWRWITHIGDIQIADKIQGYCGLAGKVKV